ncbi:MAG: GntR family transcriptional regulator [Ktedonobacteraceae bacterium]
MPKRAAFLPHIAITLDPGAPESLQRQIYQWIRQAILGGQLRAGQRLPSMRTLASELGVSRNTTSLAYAQLLAEGYVQSKVGQGTIIGPNIPEKVLSGVVSSSHPVMSEEALPSLSHSAGTKLFLVLHFLCGKKPP